jgi:hypothetical protein
LLTQGKEQGHIFLPLLLLIKNRKKTPPRIPAVL